MIKQTIRNPKKNHISFKWLLYPKDEGSIIIETDASTGYEMGGIEMKPGGAHYAVAYKLLHEWPTGNESDIECLELAAIYVLIKLKAATYDQKAILIRCDNEAVCALLRKKSACLERKDLQQLVIKICDMANRYCFYFWIRWISTKDNVRADGISRGEPAALDTISYRTIGMDRRATEIAEEAMTIYKKVRKRMMRHKGCDKQCDCDDPEMCEDQPLYKKWRQPHN